MAPFKNHNQKPTMPDWYAHQHLLNRTRARKTLFQKGLRLGLLTVILVAVVYGIIQCFLWIVGGNDSISETAAATSAEASLQPEGKQLAREILQEIPFMNRQKAVFQANRQDKTLVIDTSIDPSLQTYMLKKLDRKNSRHIALLAMDPSSGEIIMMAGYDKVDPQGNTCLVSTYPAASIFKIVTAAAAIEQRGLDSNSKLRFNGNQHTLYKAQLKDRNNRYTNHTTFQAAFAKSINPVFGKLGALNLQRSHLVSYAESFGFNSDINFELPVPPSHFRITDKPYHWAEIASGFNRDTTLSAIHAALLPAVVLNQGKQVDPTIVRQITDGSGHVLYQNRPTPMKQVITPRASRVVYDLMEATIRYGTAKKAFKGFQKDPVLSKCNLGGKTGSIFNKKHDLRYDWFVGFADLKNGDKKLAIAIVVAHEEYIGIRAAAYARMAIKKYFSDFFQSG
jgi:penicillin-binding protein A